MYVKVEPSGCCERKGMLQIRFSFYLDPIDFGYKKHHIEVPVIPEGGYPGKVDEQGSPIDIKDYEKWLKKLPTVWQNNPFHNHFIYVETDISDKEIMDIGKAFLAECYIKWEDEEILDLKNPPITFPTVIDNTRLETVEAKVKHLKETVLESKI